MQCFSKVATVDKVVKRKKKAKKKKRCKLRGECLGVIRNIDLCLTL